MAQPRLAFVVYSGPHEGARYPVERWPVSIGRHPRNTIALADERTVSNHHCRVVEENNKIWVYDLKSDNGTYLNGHRVDYRAELNANNSVLILGYVKLALVDELAQPSEERIAAPLLSAGSIVIPPTRLFQRAEEVVLVVDVVESTRLGVQRGDASMVKSLWILARVFERYAQAHGVLFMKCTGDGFLATFEACGPALSVACQVLNYFSNRAAPPGEPPPPSLRFALHRGPVTVNEEGDRFGLAVHLCFRVEGLRGEGFAPEPGAPPLPSFNRILVTDRVCSDIPSEWRGRVVALGSFRPKGFEESVRVHAVNWEEAT
jgi:class 3 adenylate cyclase